jgi:tRNA pseudouridine55 synthase
VLRVQIDDALQQFLGRISQVPPMYSAIKQRGKRLYELARQGIEVEVPAREVEIHELRVVEWVSPVLRLRVHCGPGTYIRALARDIGEALGCGAHLTALRRVSSGSFAASEAVTLAQLGEAFAATDIARYLQPPDVAFLQLPALRLGSVAARRLAMGQPVTHIAATGQGPSPGADDELELARAYAPGEQFVALVYRDRQSGTWRPRKVFVEPQEIPSPHPADV